MSEEKDEVYVYDIDGFDDKGQWMIWHSMHVEGEFIVFACPTCKTHFRIRKKKI